MSPVRKGGELDHAWRKIAGLEAELVAVRSQLDRVTELRDMIEKHLRANPHGTTDNGWLAVELTTILKANDE